MSFQNYLLNGLDNRPVFSFSGNQRLLLAPATAISRVALGNETGSVTDVQLHTGYRWNMFNEPENLSYSVTPETSRHGTVYTINIGFQVNYQTRAKNALFDSMRQTDMVAVVQDNNNQYWLCGLEQPLRLESQSQQVDTDTNQYSIKLSGKQRENVKSLSATWVNSLNSDSFTPMIDSIDGALVDIRFDTAIQNGGSTTPTTPTTTPDLNHFYTTITSPPSGYVIDGAIAIVNAAAGTTIKLPATGIPGETHTVKDYRGAGSTAAITINGNGKLIDGNPEVKITTDYGSISFTYGNNTWLTTAFIN